MYLTLLVYTWLRGAIAWTFDLLVAIPMSDRTRRDLRKRIRRVLLTISATSYGLTRIRALRRALRSSRQGRRAAAARRSGRLDRRVLSRPAVQLQCLGLLECEPAFGFDRNAPAGQAPHRPASSPPPAVPRRENRHLQVFTLRRPPRLRDAHRAGTRR